MSEISLAELLFRRANCISLDKAELNVDVYFRSLAFFIFLFFSQKLFSYEYELAVASMFRNCAPYIKEWVEYHRIAGVDHFWLYDDASTDDWQSELAPYVESGLVEVFYWPAGKPDWIGLQIKAFQDGLNRAVGVAKWIAFIDQDEFILPMKDRSIPECLEKRFGHAQAVYANWYHFGTSYVTLAEGEPILTRLTLSAEAGHPRNAVGKSIIRPEYADIDQLWSPHFCPLIGNALYVNGDGMNTFAFRGIDLVSNDGISHSKFIRINHYAHRDEKYFQETRLPRDPDPQLILEHYEAFNFRRNYDILRFLKKYHSDDYSKYWKPVLKK